LPFRLVLSSGSVGAADEPGIFSRLLTVAQEHQSTITYLQKNCKSAAGSLNTYDTMYDDSAGVI
jgi:hypothetical protein